MGIRGAIYIYNRYFICYLVSHLIGFHYNNNSKVQNVLKATGFNVYSIRLVNF